MSFLSFHFFSELFIQSDFLFFQSLQPPFCQFRKHHHFAGRINAHPLQIFNGALTLHIKPAHGINFISPQLNTTGIFFCQGKNIQNPAPNGKLPGGLHLVITLIAHLHQTVFHLFHIQSFPQGIFQNSLTYMCKRYNSVHQGIKSGNHRHLLLLQNGFYRSEPFSRQQISPDIRLIKQHVPGRIVQYLPVEKPVIFIQFFCFLFLKSYNQTAFPFLEQTVHEMRLLGIYAPGNLHHFLSFL